MIVRWNVRLPAGSCCCRGSATAPSRLPPAPPAVLLPPPAPPLVLPLPPLPPLPLPTLPPLPLPPRGTLPPGNDKFGQRRSIPGGRARPPPGNLEPF